MVAPGRWVVSGMPMTSRREAGFQATIQRAPVAGVAIATIRGGIGTVGFAFDSPNTIARTLPRLLQLGGSPAGGSQGGCPPPPVNWQVVPYPDGSDRSSFLRVGR